jgi:hypothetical protein
MGSEVDLIEIDLLGRLSFEGNWWHEVLTKNLSEPVVERKIFLGFPSKLLSK